MRINIASMKNYHQTKLTHHQDLDARHADSYLWLDIIFNSDVALISASEGTASLSMAISWYKAYRWSFHTFNEHLDSLIESNPNLGCDISKKEYRLHYHAWGRRVRMARWTGERL